MSKLTEVSIKNGCKATCNHNRKLIYSLSLILLIFFLTSSAQAKYSGGTGEPNDPYQIADANDMNEIGTHIEDWNDYFVLVNDINLADYTGTQFNIIGTSSHQFAGVFDGNGHSISNFTYITTDSDIGLFSTVGGSAIIKDLGLIGVNVNGGSGGDRVGSLIGYFANGTATACYVDGGSVSGNEYIGGLAGSLYKGRIENSWAAVQVSGQDYVGGLVGKSSSQSKGIGDSYATGTVSGDDYIGGLVGYFDSSANGISDSYATGNVSGDEEVGGLVGKTYYSPAIVNCFAAGDVLGLRIIGGLIGHNLSTNIINCYASGEVETTLHYAGGLVGENQGTIENSFAIGDVSGPDGDIGGLVGINGDGWLSGGSSSGTVTNCCAFGNVSGGTRVGGLAGSNCYGSLIASCYCLGDVTGTGTATGGLVGESYMARILDCYSTSNVIGNSRVGGLAGSVNGSYLYSYDNDFRRCYSTGSVTGNSSVGGLVGYRYWTGVYKSFWDVNSSGMDTSAAGTGKTTPEMQMESTFASGGWDFTTPIWVICGGTNYPKLAWQIPTLGDFICPDGVDFIDFSILASSWLSAAGEIGWNIVCDISDPSDNVIDELDLAIFCENWLAGVK